MTPPAWRERRLFLSSTFRDFHAERDHLHAVVFPALEERLLDRRNHLVPVDLRWGVETTSQVEADAKEFQVLKVCLTEIDRCRPFILVLLGDRYGWVPAGARITAAAREAGFNADVDGKSVTALEVEYGILADEAQERRTFIYMREPLPYDDMPAPLAAAFSELRAGDAGAPERHARLTALKARVASEMPDRVRYYQAAWDAEHKRVCGLEAWGQQVLDDLWSVLDVETALDTTATQPTWQNEERRNIEAFVEYRGRLVLGRDALLEALQTKALSPMVEDAPWGTVVVAEPGSGKSAVLSALYLRLSAQPEVLVLAQFAGISARAGSIEALLRRFCQEMAVATQRADPCSDAMGFEELQKAFVDLLSRTTTNRRVVMLLDALNEFEQSPVARHLTWLPERWPQNGRLVATSLPGPEAEALLQRKGVDRVDLARLGGEDAKGIVEVVCARYRKTLPKRARDALLDRKGPDGALACGLPLWLHLAIEDLLLLDEDDFARAAGYSGTPEQQLDALLVDTAREMPGDIQGLYGALLDRAEDVYGAAWARAFAELLATSRHGLRETDLVALMPTLSGEQWDPLRFANLRRGFRAHVVLRGEPPCWDFFHGQIREAIGVRGLADAEHCRRLHATIAAHLAGLNADDSLRCSERMVHLIGADDVALAALAYGQSESSEAELYGATQALRAHAIAIGATAGATVPWFARFVRTPSFEQWDTRLERFVFKFLAPGFDVLGPGNATAVAKETLSVLEDVEIFCKNRDGVRLTQAVCLNALGACLAKIGQFAEARLAYAKAVRIAYIAVKQGSSKFAALLPRSLAGLSAAQTEAGEHAKATRTQATALQLSEAIGTHVGGSATDREIARSLQEMGDRLHAAGRVAEAIDKYKQALILDAAAPDDDVAESQASRAFGKLAVLHMDLGQLALARHAALGAMEIDERAARKRPDSHSFRHLVASLMQVGDIYRDMKDFDAAREAYLRALRVCQELHRAAPAGVETLRDLSVCLDGLGNLDVCVGNLMDAKQAFERSLSLREDLCRRLPESLSVAREVAVSLDDVGDVSLLLGEDAIAQRRFESALALRKDICGKRPNSEEAWRDLAVSGEKLARFHARHGCREGSLAALEILRDALHQFDVRGWQMEPELRSLLLWADTEL